MDFGTLFSSFLLPKFVRNHFCVSDNQFSYLKLQSTGPKDSPETVKDQRLEPFHRSVQKSQRRRNFRPIITVECSKHTANINIYYKHLTNRVTDYVDTMHLLIVDCHRHHCRNLVMITMKQRSGFRCPRDRLGLEVNQ